MGDDWYRIANEAEIPSPALLVYPNRIVHNLHRMVEIAGMPARLRPHVKTHKLPELIGMQLSLGIDKFKCATIAEAEMVAGSGGMDILRASTGGAECCSLAVPDGSLSQGALGGHCG